MHLSASWFWLVWLPIFFFLLLLISINCNIFIPFWLTFSLYPTLQINTCFCFVLFCFVLCFLYLFVCFFFFVCLCLFLFIQRIVHLLLIHHNVVRIPIGIAATNQLIMNVSQGNHCGFDIIVQTVDRLKYFKKTQFVIIKTCCQYGNCGANTCFYTCGCVCVCVCFFF